jgi:hypothetical protein
MARNVALYPETLNGHCAPWLIGRTADGWTTYTCTLIGCKSKKADDGHITSKDHVHRVSFDRRYIEAHETYRRYTDPSYYTFDYPRPPAALTSAPPPPPAAPTTALMVWGEAPPTSAPPPSSSASAPPGLATDVSTDIQERLRRLEEKVDLILLAIQNLPRSTEDGHSVVGSVSASSGVYLEAPWR